VVLDVSNPNPQRLAGFATKDSVIDAKALSEQFLLLAGDGGLDVIDIANPRVPRAVRSLPTFGPATEISIFGSYAFVAKGDAVDCFLSRRSMIGQ